MSPLSTTGGRTSLFRRFYAARRAKKFYAADPLKDQDRILHRFLKRGEETHLGREAGFSSIRTVEEYQRALPLRQYEDFWNEYWKAAFAVVQNLTWPGKYHLYAVTSGTTTGGTKYIPFTEEMWQANRRAALDLLSLHVTAHPKSRLMDGLLFFLGGSTVLKEEAPGVQSGDLSGVAALKSPWYIQPLYFPGKKDALIADWDEKLTRFAERGAETDIRLFSGVPSWMLLLFEKMEQLTGRRIPELWPQFELLIHGGVRFDPYRPLFEEHLRRKDGSLPHFLEVYPASEGFFAFSEPGRRDMRLLTDHQVFYEFVPLEELESKNPTAHTLATAEIDRPYAIVITTGAGLWRYVVGDVIRFTQLRENGHCCPRLVFAGRTKQGLSAFGEHLIGEEVDRALAEACRAAEASLRDYTMTAVYPSAKDELGGHELAIEFITTPSDLALFEKVFDSTLCAENEDYAAHRSKGFGLKAPRVIPVPPGSFEEWMRRRGKLGGQNKVPRLSASREYLEGVLETAGVLKGNER